MAAKSSGRSSAQSGASTECGTAAGRAERLDAHSRHILLNEDGTVSQVALTLLLIQVHALRETSKPHLQSLLQLRIIFTCHR
jgi:hypothetical protein